MSEVKNKRMDFLFKCNVIYQAFAMFDVIDEIITEKFLKDLEEFIPTCDDEKILLFSMNYLVAKRDSCDYGCLISHLQFALKKTLNGSIRRTIIFEEKIKEKLYEITKAKDTLTPQDLQDIDTPPEFYPPKADE